MLRLFDSAQKIDLHQLYGVYSGGIQDFFDYWRYDFFSVSGALCAVWEMDGMYVSALRLEPYKDGLLLAGLETAPGERRKGYANALMLDVIRYLNGSGVGRIYSHVDKRNVPSLRLHENCGFLKIADYAVFLDGSVSHNYKTYLYHK